MDSVKFCHDRCIATGLKQGLLVLTPLVLFTDVVCSTSSLSAPSGLETYIIKMNSYHYTNKTQTLTSLTKVFV